MAVNRLSSQKNSAKLDGNQKKPKRKLNVKKMVMVIAVTGFAIYFVYVLIWQQFTIGKKNSEIDALQTQIETAKQETDKLQSELEKVNDPEYLERMARERLGLVEANERVFVDANQGE